MQSQKFICLFSVNLFKIYIQVLMFVLNYSNKNLFLTYF